jgi:LysM repeat protein
MFPNFVLLKEVLMNEDYFERTRDEVDESIGERIGYSTTDQRMRHRKSFLSFMPPAKTLILIGAGILFFIILIALLSGDNSELLKKDIAAISKRVDLLEKRLIRLEEAELRIAALQKQGNTLQQSLGEADRSIKSLTQRVDSLTQSFEARAKETPSVTKEIEASADKKRKAVSPDKRSVHEVRRGDSLYRIALKYGLTVDELCKLNNIKPNQAIYPGQKLFVTSGGD